MKSPTKAKKSPATRRSRKTTKVSGDKNLPRSIGAIRVSQGGRFFYLFSMRASELYDLVQINRRSEDKRDGYQRALSPSRVRSISKYIANGGIIPGAIVISLDSGEFDEAANCLRLPDASNIGWVIDGQHRLAGSFEASEEGVDLELAVVAFLAASIEEQIELFITINREARGVPASLYIDLLKDLPKKKSDKEITDERIADIARRLNTDENSPFYQRIIFTRNARAGEISLVNFARILRPHIARQSGTLSLYTQPLQEGAINNYYKALMTAFPKAAEKDIFFRTVGFGAVWRAFPLIFNLAISHYKAFSVSAITKIFAEISDFDFDSWSELGSGSGAEIQAGEDLIESIQNAFADEDSPSVALKLD